ncbi:MAG: hypothetical protein M3Q57_04020 [Pseudomonadota bacterium]|nr:hypothetical protein [Pseudomonadota bacterium]
MAVFLLSIAALAVQAPPPQKAERAAGGAQASANVTARIISRPARIGADLPPPMAGMVPRPMRTAAADGSLADALIYEYE